MPRHEKTNILSMFLLCISEIWLITVANFAVLFNCTSVDRVSDSMMAPTYCYSFKLVGTGTLRLLLVHRGSTDDLLLLQITRGVV